MTKLVLDASAVTAVLRQEPGAENVIPHLRGSLISSVNLAEVFCITQSRGSRLDHDEFAVRSMHLQRVPFDDAQARVVATIFPKTTGSTIGFADRACLALALSHNLPVLTSDRDWLKPDLGIEVRLFRGSAR
jgi:ribonuclease VapC